MLRWIVPGLFDALGSDAVAADAAASSRLRRHWNQCPESHAPQRWFNVLQPAAGVRPRQHQADQPSAPCACGLELQSVIVMQLSDHQGDDIGQNRLTEPRSFRGLENAQGVRSGWEVSRSHGAMSLLCQGAQQPTADHDGLAGFTLRGSVAALDQKVAWRQKCAADVQGALNREGSIRV